MSSTLEIEGKNVDQAVQKACQRLNLTPEELKYDILSYGSTGIFGLGRTRNARIRVRMNKAASAAENSGGQPPREEKAEPSGDRFVPVHADADVSVGKPDRSAEADRTLVQGRDVLQRIIDAITDDAHIHTEEQAQRVIFRVEGGNAAILIGKHGQTLEAIQSLVDKVINKHNSDRIRIQVDVGGYLKNREKRLVRNAERLAQKCRRTHKPVSAGLLNAHDRRIVHLALKDHREVHTRSTGDGPLRNLMILPSKPTENRQRKRGPAKIRQGSRR